MFDIDQLKLIAIKEQTHEINVTREYCQHLFLSYLSKTENYSDLILFKGGTALRIVFQSPRYSEDLDFSAHKTYMMDDLLSQMIQRFAEENISVELYDNLKTTGGYIAFLKFNLPSPLESPVIKINVHETQSSLEKSSKLIQNKFVPPYYLEYLNDETMVKEKVQAFRSRVKARDFFDIWYMLDNNDLRGYVVKHGVTYKVEMLDALDRMTDKELKGELSTFLPISYRNLYTGDGFRSKLKKQIERYVVL